MEHANTFSSTPFATGDWIWTVLVGIHVMALRHGLQYACDPRCSMQHPRTRSTPLLGPTLLGPTLLGPTLVGPPLLGPTYVAHIQHADTSEQVCSIRSPLSTLGRIAMPISGSTQHPCDIHATSMQHPCDIHDACDVHASSTMVCTHHMCTPPAT